VEKIAAKLQKDMTQTPDCEYINNLFTADECAYYEQIIQEKTEWKQQTVKMFGKSVPEPRLSAWYGTYPYRYSGTIHIPRAYYSELQQISDRITNIAKCTFNSVLINLYRDGNDSMGWHSDDEAELGAEPVIASISFGAAREIIFRHRKNHALQYRVLLNAGSLLLMRGLTQSMWQHCIPKRKHVHAARINLTFRKIIPIVPTEKPSQNRG